jgi:quinol monooxygenase YgiN
LGRASRPATEAFAGRGEAAGEETAMTVFNVVRMRVKPGEEGAYLEAHRRRGIEDFPGMLSFNVVKTGDRDFCVIGEWRDMDALAAARPMMIATLDSFRDRLEDLGGGLGVTDPVSGESVFSRSG